MNSGCCELSQLLAQFGQPFRHSRQSTTANEEVKKGAPGEILTGGKAISAALTYGDKRVRYAGRGRAASPATGSKAVHLREQKRLVEKAFNV